MKVSLAKLDKISPKTRDTKSESYAILLYAGYVLRSIALILAIGTAICVNVWKDHQIIKSSQLDVLRAKLIGYILARLTAVLHAVVETSDTICTL